MRRRPEEENERHSQGAQAQGRLNDGPPFGWAIALKAAVVTCASRSVKSQARRRCTIPSACPSSHPTSECMPASDVLQQLLQLLCCCSTPGVDMDSAKCGPCGMNPKTKKPRMASYAARKTGKPSEPPQKKVPKHTTSHQALPLFLI